LLGVSEIGRVGRGKERCMTAWAGRSACEASAVWRIDLALSGSRGQSVEEVGNVMRMFMYTAEVTGRACHWWEGVFDGGNSEVK